MGLLGGNTNNGATSLMASTGNTLGSFIGNILHGLAGGTTTYGRSGRSQRDIERRILTNIKTNETGAVSDEQEVEGRILNKGDTQTSSFVKFPYDEEEGLRSGRLYDPSQDYSNYVNEEPTLKFSRDHRHVKQYYDGNYFEQSGTKIIFPDRESTGNLRFDNRRISKDRLGRILNYKSNNYQSNYNNYSNRRPHYSRRDHGTTANNKPLTHQPATRTTSKPVHNEFEGNVYVTNSQGVVEYYINKQGRKVYVPFD